MLSKIEQQHYHRQLILTEIGEIGQSKLKKAAVLVIGAGGLGSAILPYLTAAGVGQIGIMDHDIVTLSIYIAKFYLLPKMLVRIKQLQLQKN